VSVKQGINRYKNTLIMNNICKHCNEPFKPARRDSEYCSPSCRNKAYYERRVTADPLYPQKVNEKRQLSIQKENEARERRTQEIRERIRKEKEQQAIEIKESRKLAIRQEQERHELAIYTQQIKEKQQAEENAKREAQRQKALADLEAERKAMYSGESRPCIPVQSGPVLGSGLLLI
jgi:hypothetical protein